jgi:predicted nucleic acid-binding protein
VTDPPPLVFLDANVLFSMAIGGPAFELILELGSGGRARLVTSARCKAEAERNLLRKRPESAERVAGVLVHVAVLPVSAPDDPSAVALVGEADAHVLSAALSVNATVLVTGDIRDFGALMERNDIGVRVRTPRAFLLEGPP